MDGSKYKCFWKVGSAENVSTGFLKSMCIYLVWKAIVRLTDFQLHPLANCTTIWLVLTNKLQFTSFYFQFQFSLLNCMCSCRQSTFFSEATPPVFCLLFPFASLWLWYIHFMYQYENIYFIYSQTVILTVDDDDKYMGQFRLF